MRILPWNFCQVWFQNPAVMNLINVVLVNLMCEIDILLFFSHTNKVMQLYCIDLGLLCDLLWSDPDKDVQGWGENDRGVSFTFGPDIVSKFLAKHDLDLICRAHQVRHDQSMSKRQY